MMDIALCADRTIIPGVHVTIASMLYHETSGPIRIHLVHDGYYRRVLGAIEKKLLASDPETFGNEAVTCR